MTRPLLADILPTPRECRFPAGGFTVGPALRVHHPATAAEADVRAARLLVDLLGKSTGVRPRIATTARYVHRHVLYVGADDRFDVPADVVPPRHEAYALRVDRAGMLLAGADPAGLFYAVQTLGQVLRLRRRAGRTIPALCIRDWPELRHRAVMMDIARQVERPDAVEDFVRRTAAYKKNMFVLYFEDKFRWRGHKALSHPLGYTPAEFRALARVAEQHHVEFVPALPCLGHCEGILKHPDVARLREDGAIYQLSLRHPGTRRLLAEQILEILPLYRGRFFHANCDESPLLAGPPGSPRSYLAESLRLFTDHLVFLHDLLGRHGKRMMIWGDMLLHYPRIADGLPRDVIIVDWDYGSMAHRRRQAPRRFRQLGFDVMVAPAACRSAEVFYPPAMQMADNVPNFIRQGRDAGAIGEMTTLWEMRSTNPIVAWPGVVASAQAAWNPDAVAPGRLAPRVAAHLHGSEVAAAVARAWRSLGGELFYDRFRHEADSPEMPAHRTYHLDSHEFVATDPLVYLTFAPTPWADRVTARAARAVAALIDARRRARWGRDDLDVAQLAGMQQAYHGQRRSQVNAAGRRVVDAERLRRHGRHRDAARRLDDGANELAELADLAHALIPASRDLWRRTRHMADPALDNIYLRRLKLDRSSLRRHAARLRRAAGGLARGLDVDLSRLIGGQPVLLIEAANPSRSLIDILHAEVTISADGRRWRTISDKGWFTLTRQTYIAAIIPQARLPRHVRLHVVRTHINPKRFPLDRRIVVGTARTLTPGEIIDGPAEADIRTTDWRLARTPEIAYRLTGCRPWRLEYELAPR